MIMNRHLSFAVLAVLAAALAACAPTFSREAMDRVSRDVSFRDVQKDPLRFKGTWVMVGGMILETRNSPEGTSIEVLQRPLDSRGRPEETDETEGRFIIVSAQYLDPAVYYGGKRISIVGEVTGQEVRPLGGINYLYPMIAAREVRLWEPWSEPRFSFGIGIGSYHRF